METNCGRQTEKIAFIVAANVIGGHEFQTRALVDDFGQFAEVTVYLNSEEQHSLFGGVRAHVEIRPSLFLQAGWIGKQVVSGLVRMHEIRALLRDYDRIVVCAGSVEAGVCTSVALIGRRNVLLYLPFFYDRTVLWGRLGCIYNQILGTFGILYQQIITINRIQARLVRWFLGRPTTVVPNRITDVPVAKEGFRGRMLYIGRLDHQKRVPELLEWVDFADNPYREILVMGDGPERELVQIVGDGLRNVEARLVGWKSVSEQAELICSQDVLLLNSLIEGEPLVVREAHKRGIPVIARDIAGIRGCVPRRNRFDSKESLRNALKSAGLRLLLTKLECSNDSIRRKRLIAIGDLLAR